MGSARRDRQTRRRRGPGPDNTAAKQRPSPQETPPQPESARKVFATHELLEEILLQVDQRSLLTSAQRVCVRWHDIISSLPSLQRHLFFLAAPPTTSSSDSAAANLKTEFVPNPLLHAAFPCFYPHRGMHPAWQESAGIVPLGAGFVAAASTPEGKGEWGVDPDEVLPMTDVRHHGARNLAFTRSGASWRRMLLSQPPPRRVVRVELIIKPSFHLGWKMVDFPAGLTMGELFDEVFTMNWTVNQRCAARRCSFGCHGDPAQIAWRVPAEMVVPRTESAPDPPSHRPPPPEWVASADLVVGEDCWYDYHADQCRHPSGKDGMGARCFLWQQGHLVDTRHTSGRSGPRPKPVGGKAMKWLYQCRDYKPGGPLSLPPLDKSRRR